MTKKTQNKLRKALLLVCSAMLLVSITIGATVAYLTSQTQQVVNTFTVGAGVEITLDEANVKKAEADDEDGKYKAGDYIKDGDTRVQENKYKLHPGITALKDPTIHVANTSDECWVIAKIEVTADDMAALRNLIGYENGLLGLQGIVSGGVLGSTYTASTVDGVATWTSDDYKLTQATVDDTTTGTYKNVFYVYFKDIQEAGADLVLFDTIKISNEWTSEQMNALKGLKIDAIAYAVQADGFTSVEAAYEAAVETKDIAG